MCELIPLKLMNNQPRWSNSYFFHQKHSFLSLWYQGKVAIHTIMVVHRIQLTWIVMVQMISMGKYEFIHLYYNLLYELPS